jgi:site-specific DNA-methyltransferase (adenine-specific)
MTKDFYRQRSVGAWYIAPVSSNKCDHPAPYPSKLAEDAIRLWSWPTDLVVDPWSGTGTTPAMAAFLGRRYIGIDKVDKYCRMSNARVLDELKRRQMKLKNTLAAVDAVEKAPSATPNASK